jgi:hypothetical protein
VPRTSSTWFFAEGTAATFDTFLLLTNTGDQYGRATVDFFAADGRSFSHDYELAPGTLTSVLANTVTGPSGPFWSRVQSDVPIVAERAMYLASGPTHWRGGHTGTGVLAPSSTWYFAEGVTGPYIDSWMLLANPQATPVTVDISWLRPAGKPIRETRTLGAGERATIGVDARPGLANTTFAVALTASAPIVAERSMYWPGGPNGMVEGHTSAGMPRLGTRWVLAEGEVGGTERFQSQILLANPGAGVAHATITILREGGEPMTLPLTIAAESRVTVSLASLGLAPHERVGVVVDSDAPIAVERTMYWKPDGWGYPGGTNETGLRVR